MDHFKPGGSWPSIQHVERDIRKVFQEDAGVNRVIFSHPGMKEDDLSSTICSHVKDMPSRQLQYTVAEMMEHFSITRKTCITKHRHTKEILNAKHSIAYTSKKHRLNEAEENERTKIAKLDSNYHQTNTELLSNINSLVIEQTNLLPYHIALKLQYQKQNSSEHSDADNRISNQESQESIRNSNPRSRSNFRSDQHVSIAWPLDVQNEGRAIEIRYGKEFLNQPLNQIHLTSLTSTTCNERSVSEDIEQETVTCRVKTRAFLRQMASFVRSICSTYFRSSNK
jgi:hypothetical protein